MKMFHRSRDRQVRTRSILWIGVIGPLAAVLIYVGSGYGTEPAAPAQDEAVMWAGDIGEGDTGAGDPNLSREELSEAPDLCEAQMAVMGAGRGGRGRGPWADDQRDRRNRRPGRAEFGSHGPGRSGMLGPGLGWMAGGRLQLSETQREAMRPVIEEYGKGMRDVQESFAAGSLDAEQAGEKALGLRQDAEKKAQSILTPEQWTKVQGFREGRQDRMIERRADRLGQSADRQARFYIRRLGLNKEQASSVRRIYEETIPERRGVADQVQAGSIPPEKAFFSMRQIDQDAQKKVRSLLAPEQEKRLDELKELRPLGPVSPGRDQLGRRGPGAQQPGRHRPGRRSPKI